ncbi:response regulator [Paracoccus sp. WLY502]|uniref:response regulator n=1 Tax=Paracoccus yibinensis TaxID=3068891 RepID=UPI0027963F7F|nr:response regulator [Paracoccus sp. WLY502]MDQ1902659.1 response regulator [Paracoccus sp. WLY502]
MLDRFARYALVADDSPLIRMDAQAILTEAGFRVFTAAGFEDAMEILASRGHGIRLLFTDVQMPPGKMTGCDLALRCARDWPEIAVIVTSGAMPPKPGDLPEGALFVPKPFTEETVRRCIRELMKE